MSFLILFHAPISLPSPHNPLVPPSPLHPPLSADSSCSLPSHHLPLLSQHFFSYRSSLPSSDTLGLSLASNCLPSLSIIKSIPLFPTRSLYVFQSLFFFPSYRPSIYFSLLSSCSLISPRSLHIFTRYHRSYPAHPSFLPLPLSLQYQILTPHFHLIPLTSPFYSSLRPPILPSSSP